MNNNYFLQFSPVQISYKDEFNLYMEEKRKREEQKMLGILKIFSSISDTASAINSMVSNKKGEEADKLTLTFVNKINSNIEENLKEIDEFEKLWKSKLLTSDPSSQLGSPVFKNGSKIHIKKKNRGKFTDYCGGKVTQECINKAKKSGNSTLIKRAVFAENARKWNH